MSAENMSAWNMVKGASGTVYVWSYSNGFVLYKADMTNKELVKAALPFDEVYSSDTYPVSGYGDSELLSPTELHFIPMTRKRAQRLSCSTGSTAASA